jgi:heat shock protein beta
VTLHLKEDALELADPVRLARLIKQYSQFIQFPIKLWNSRKEPKKVRPVAREGGGNAVMLLFAQQREGVFTRLSSHGPMHVCKLHPPPPPPRQVVDDEATKKKQEAEDKRAQEAGEEPKQLEPVMRTDYEDLWDWRVENENKPLWTRSPKEVSWRCWSGAAPCLAQGCPCSRHPCRRRRCCCCTRPSAGVQVAVCVDVTP